MADERRKFVRFPVPLRAELIAKVEVDSIQQGITKDFSREGLRLILRNFDLAEGKVIDLRIYVPQKKEPVPLKGEIIWSRPDNNWEVGIKITDIDKGAKSDILDYAYRTWKDKIKESR